MHKEEVIVDEQIDMLELRSGSEANKNVYGKKETEKNQQSSFFTSFLNNQKQKPFRLPKCQISRGLVTGIGSIILFSSLCVWYLYEDEHIDYNHRNSTSNATHSNHFYDNTDYEGMNKPSAPIHFVLLITVLIVFIIILMVFIGAILHHIRSKKDQDSISNLKVGDIFRGIFASNKNQHRTQLYYLNQDYSAEREKNTSNFSEMQQEVA